MSNKHDDVTVAGLLVGYTIFKLVGNIYLSSNSSNPVAILTDHS